MNRREGKGAGYSSERRESPEGDGNSNSASVGQLVSSASERRESPEGDGNPVQIHPEGQGLSTPPKDVNPRKGTETEQLSAGLFRMLGLRKT